MPALIHTYRHLPATGRVGAMAFAATVPELDTEATTGSSLVSGIADAALVNASVTLVLTATGGAVGGELITAVVGAMALTVTVPELGTEATKGRTIVSGFADAALVNPPVTLLGSSTGAVAA